MQKECEETKADEINIVSKIKKRDEELKRTEQRLLSIQQSRQKSMKESEKEKLEKELERHYEIYMEKYRNLDYLEHELEKYHRDEQERKEEQERKLKKMRERLLKEEVDLLRGGRRDDEPSYTKYEARSGGEKARSQAALNRHDNRASMQGSLQGISIYLFIICL
jgi:clusterin-associated protein 1